jgi:hypothetical protein
MLKIWLTWLQPSLGILGTALVLSNPLCSNAANKPTVANKVSTQPLQWSGVRSSSTKIAPQLLNGIAMTPDVAIRQLAIGSMGTTGLQPNNFTSKIPQRSQKAISSFVSSSHRVKPVLAAKATKHQNSNNPVAAALALASQPSSMVPVPGLYIGNTDVRVSDRFLPAVKPLSRSTGSATEIGSPTPMSAMVSARGAVERFPVVRPEQMQKLGTSTFASAPAVRIAPYALDPIAAIPTSRSQAATPKLLNFKAAPAQSLDPIAAIPTGLQKLLGNNLNNQPIVAATAVASKPSSFLALKQLLAPNNAISSASVTGTSLQLATAQAYTSVPKFSIPGETILAVKPAVTMPVVQRIQKDSTVAVVGRKNNYVLMSDRQLTLVKKQSWMTSDRQSNLGGLILGSQPQGMIPKVASLLPASNLAE